jgi:D-tyrosyl-tRNA(Tyr) deacylase
LRALVQRVREAHVTVAGHVTGAIGRGLLVLAGVGDGDTDDDRDWLARKIVQMRIFDDADGVMNLSVGPAGGGILAVSQFTLYASTRKGNRPSWSNAARPEVAQPAFDAFVHALTHELGGPVATGVFGATMDVALVNDGPVTIWLDSRARE